MVNIQFYFPSKVTPTCLVLFCRNLHSSIHEQTTQLIQCIQKIWGSFWCNMRLWLMIRFLLNASIVRGMCGVGQYHKNACRHTHQFLKREEEEE